MVISRRGVYKIGLFYDDYTYPTILGRYRSIRDTAKSDVIVGVK